MMLYNSCINSFARFGEFGFNQGYGNRNYTKNYDKETHDSIKSRLSRTIITNENFFDLKFQENSLLFLDPPYIERPSSYSTITNDEFHKFVKSLKESPNEILYTDLEHEWLDWKYIILRNKMITTSPLKVKTMTTGKFEVMYYNYEVKRNELF